MPNLRKEPIPEYDESIVTEQNLLEAELICGYKYWKVHDEAEEVAARAEDAYNDAAQKRAVAVADKAASVKSELSVDKLSESQQEKIREDYRIAVESAKAEQEKIKAQNDASKKKKRRWLLLSFLMFLFAMPLAYLGGSSGKIPVFMPFVGTFVILLTVFLILYYLESKKPLKPLNSLPTFEEYVSKKYTKDNLYKMYLQQPSNAVEAFENKSMASVSLAEKKMQTAKLGVAKIRVGRGESDLSQSDGHSRALFHLRCHQQYAVFLSV